MTLRPEPAFAVPKASDPSGAEQMLAEAARRAARQPRGRVAFVLHLSHLSPPAPRPHHRRIARAILQDVAQRHEGQVFAPRNGDLVLLCRAADQFAVDMDAPAVAGSPSSLPGTMARLLARDVPDVGMLVSIWPLDRAADVLAAYAQARLDEVVAVPAGSEEPAGIPADVDSICAVVASGSFHDLMQRQTAIVLQLTQRDEAPKGALPAHALRPLYREIGFSIGALEARIRRGGQASADPFLFRHLAGQLDRRMLDVLASQFGSLGPLDLAPHPANKERMADWPSTHLNLTVPAVLSDSFARIAQLCRDAGGVLGVEISLVEACADPAAFERARATVRDAGMMVVAEGVSHLALMLSRIEALDADLVKLDWSPRMPDLADAERRQLDAAIDRLGPNRIVLHRAETEAAIRWGLAHGVRRFQGRHVDAMLGASRIMGCVASERCTLRQCIERASATGPSGRAGCTNPGLLDAGAPARDQARPTSAERAWPRPERPMRRPEPRSLGVAVP